MSYQRSKPRIHETLLFIALLSGPPRFRERDPLASLSGAVDWSVLLSAVVWGIAALWIFFHIGGYLLKGKSIPRFGLLHILAFVLVICLYLSTLASSAPLLTFYRVSQILIAVLFGFFWVRRFGIDSTLRHLLAGYVVMSLAIVVGAIIAPDLVYAKEESNRLRGDSISETGAVTVMGLILLLSYPIISGHTRALAQATSYLFSVALFALFFTLLVMSQTRAAFIAMLLFILLAFVRPPKNTSLRFFLYLMLILVPIVLWFDWASPIIEAGIRQEGSVHDLSDRVPLWQYITAETLNHSPLLGFGFYANRAITTTYNQGLGTSHSAYMEIFAGGGVLSLSVFAILLVAELFLAVRLFVLHGANPKVFTVVSLFLTTLVLGVVSEAMVIASVTSFTFWILLSLIPLITLTATPKAQRGEIETNQYGSSSSRALPAARR
jgi:hypothetical protein